MIFDSHAHYDDEAFNEDRYEVIDKIKKSGVARVLNCGASIESSISSLELAHKYDWFYAAVGVHPESAYEVHDNINKLGDMLGDKRAAAVGEIGLDYHYDGYDRELQLRAFREQMDLARSLDLPVIIHSRDAHEDTLNVIKEFKGISGVVHCYSGSLELAREIAKYDYYFGFTGVVTFKNARKAVEVVDYLPIDRILAETDCPYMAPVPHRGERCDSSYLLHTINKIAEIKNITYEEACTATYDNASSFFRIAMH